MKIQVSGGVISPVYAISFKRNFDKFAPVSVQRPLFSIYSDPGLQDVYDDEFKVLDGNLTNFVFVTQKKQPYLMMIWEPIIEHLSWEKLRDHDEESLQKFENLRELHKHSSQFLRP